MARETLDKAMVVTKALTVANRVIMNEFEVFDTKVI